MLTKEKDLFSLKREEFEAVAQEVFDSLPEPFGGTIENVQIVVEDIPDAHVMQKTRIQSPAMLLGLYEGIPLNRRGSAYGAYPTVPDKITLYQQNIESVARTDAALRAKIRDVLIHEIAHYFGMNEEEVRNAGY